MKIEVVRVEFGEESTLSKVYVDGEYVCYGLEDQVRTGPKVRGETAIPYGTYRVTLRTEGGYHQKYTKRFPSMHKGMLWIRDVPGFEWILIHVGNSDDDTAGCLLVGTSAVQRKGEYYLGNSVGAYQTLYGKVAPALLRGEAVTITYTR